MTKQEIFADIVKSRHSTRSFLPEPIEQSVIHAVFELARWAPSNCNTQPWEVCVASGDACNALRQDISNAIATGRMAMDFPYAGTYEGVYKDRQYGAARALYNAMGIEREDKAGRDAAFFRNFTFFDAPHVAFLFMDEKFGLREAADIGMFAQTLMLAFTAYGLASCPQTALSFNADIVRKHFTLEENYKLLFGISFGKADESQAANNTRTTRELVEDSIRFKY
jgi:hypothetical protein